MKEDIKNTFHNIDFFLKKSLYSLNDMNTVLQMLEEWEIEDYYNVFQSINIFFSLENDKYVFYIDDENIFFNDNCIIKYSFGELFVKTANILRKDFAMLPPKRKGFSSFLYLPALAPIYSKYDEYISRYKKPSTIFFKEFFTDLVNIGFLDVIAILIIKDFVKWQSREDILEDFDPLKATDISHGLRHCMDSITSPDFFLYDASFFDKNASYISSFITIIRPINKIPTVLYMNVSLDSLYAFDRYNIISNNCSVKICVHCKRFYIQYKDYDTKYCSECRTISYDKKVSDPFHKLYRRKYKTMKMRADRAENTLDYEKMYTIPWISETENKLEEYRKNNDYSGFEKYIENSMDKYKPKTKGHDENETT